MQFITLCGHFDGVEYFAITSCILYKLFLFQVMNFEMEEGKTRLYTFYFYQKHVETFEMLQSTQM